MSRTGRKTCKKRGRQADAELRLWGRNESTWSVPNQLRGVSHHIRKISCLRGRSPGLHSATFPDLSRSALSWTADVLGPIAQKLNRGCTDRLGRPLCEVIQAVAFCRTSVMMNKEERGAVVAVASKKAPFWLFLQRCCQGNLDFFSFPGRKEGKA